MKPLPAAGEQRVSWRSPEPQAYLSAIEARVLDGHRYADSYLAQRLKLPRAPGATRDVVIIGLDTNQAGALVGTWDTLMGRSPGSQGHVHPDQILAIDHWLNEAVRKGDIVVFAGHHNWQSLGLPTRTMLRSLMGRLDHPLVYLSAHTHSGFWAVHRALARQPLLELSRVKPSTGYAFARIQNDTNVIVNSLLKNNHPFEIPTNSRRHNLHDALILDVLAVESEQVKPILTSMFRHNPIQRIFKFLDEETSLLEDGLVLASLPALPFLKALGRRYKRLKEARQI